MTVIEYLNAVEKSVADINRIKMIETRYEVMLDEYTAKIVSFADESIFLENERRLLSFDEIMDMSRKYENAFLDSKLIPVVDCYDGEFIVYVVTEQRWAKYSISDDVLFMARPTFSQVLV